MNPPNSPVLDEDFTGWAADLRGRVDGRADREVERTVGMRAGALDVGRHGVPRVLGQLAPQRRHVRCAQACGGRAAMIGWSKS